MSKTITPVIILDVSVLHILEQQMRPLMLINLLRLTKNQSKLARHFNEDLFFFYIGFGVFVRTLLMCPKRIRELIEP